jgi:hypothetical protein
VRCVKIVRTFAPNLGEEVESASQIKIGDELVVLSLLIDPKAAWPMLFQTLHGKIDPLWWPPAMFELVDSRIPSNWIIELRSNTSLHIAPAAWLRPGFWERFSEARWGGEHAETFAREAEVILAQS